MSVDESLNLRDAGYFLSRRAGNGRHVRNNREYLVACGFITALVSHCISNSNRCCARVSRQGVVIVDSECEVAAGCNPRCIECNYLSVDQSLNLRDAGYFLSRRAGNGRHVRNNREYLVACGFITALVSHCISNSNRCCARVSRQGVVIVDSECEVAAGCNPRCIECNYLSVDQSLNLRDAGYFLSRRAGNGRHVRNNREYLVACGFITALVSHCISNSNRCCARVSRQGVVIVDSECEVAAGCNPRCIECNYLSVDQSLNLRDAGYFLSRRAGNGRHVRNNREYLVACGFITALVSHCISNS